jgi:DNA-directed RNA polymerase specialized sigma24 family protein
VRLRATLERSRRRGLYRAKLRLGLPSTTLACAGDSPELGKALELSFAELERQLEHHIAHLRQEHTWHRKERRAGLRRLKAALTDHADAEMALFGELVRPLLPELKRFVQRELVYLQARGDLAPQDPAVDDLVDVTLARACERLPHNARRLDLLQWLYQIAVMLLSDEVARRQTEEGRMVSLEGRLPVYLREPREDDDESLFEYWQPDEVLRLEDVIPAADATPEAEASANEMHRFAAALLADMPTSWRRALMLCRVEALPKNAAARVLGASEPEVDHWLTYADAFLRAKLGDLRLTPQAFAGDEDYILAGSPSPATLLTQEFDQLTGIKART